MALKTQWMDQYYLSLRKNVSLHDTTDTTHTNTGTLNTDGAKHFSTDTEAYGFGDSQASSVKKFQLPLRNHPDFVPGQEVVTTRKTIGVPVATGGNGYEIIRGGIAPTATLEMDVDARTIVPILWSLFHQGASETLHDDTVDKSNIHFEPMRNVSGADPAAAEAYVTLLRRMSFGDADGICLSDAICSGLTFSGAEGEPFQVSAEFVGRYLYTIQNETDFTGSGAIVEGFSEMQPYLWNDAVITLEDISDDSHYIVPASAFSLTITPTISVKRYDSRWPVRYVISDWNISGSITIPWTAIGAAAGVVDENYLLRRLVRDDSATQNNIVPFEMSVNWFNDSSITTALGTNISTGDLTTLKDFTSTSTFMSGNHTATTTANSQESDMSIFMGVSPTNVETGGDDETMVTMTFDCVDIRSGNSVTQEALNIDILDGFNYGIDELGATPAIISGHPSS